MFFFCQKYLEKSNIFCFVRNTLGKSKIFFFVRNTWERGKYFSLTEILCFARNTWERMNVNVSHWQEEGVWELLAGNLFLVNIICNLSSHCCFAISNIPCHSYYFTIFSWTINCFQCLKCSIVSIVVYAIIINWSPSCSPHLRWGWPASPSSCSRTWTRTWARRARWGKPPAGLTLPLPPGNSQL